MNDNILAKSRRVEWIGEIPSPWKVGKLYQYGRLTNGSTPSKSEAKYWANGTIPWMSSGEVNKKIIKEIDAKISQLGFDNSSLEILPVGTVMIGLNGQGKTKGTVGILEVETTCNQGLCAIIPTDSLLSKYLYYFLETQYKPLRGLVGEGQRNGLSVSFMSRYPVIIPPLKEQKLISRYLDKKTEQIDSLIERIQKKIQLLKEQRTALINQCVTKGLDPNVEMKDSGVEWIGEVPKHWGIKRLKYVAKHINEKRLPNEGEVKISPENVESHTGKVTNFFSKYETEGQVFKKGDTLLNKLGVHLNKVVFCESDGLSMGEMIVIRPNRINKKYIFRALGSQRYIDYLDSLSEGVILPRVPIEDIMNSIIPVPPPP